jgi:membrane protein
VALVFAVLAWSLAYRVLPCKQSFTLVSPGALVGIPLWILASVGFSFYVAHFGDYGTAYGSLGSAVTFLLWSWLSTLILLVGGEVNAVVRELGGKA